MAQNVLVVGELVNGALAATTRELLGLASRIAEGGSVGVALLGFKAATHILISKDTFLFSVEGQLFGGLFWANVYAYLARARVRAACVIE